MPPNILKFKFRRLAASLALGASAAAAFLIFAAVPPAIAATKPGLTLTNGDQQFEIPQAMVAEWQQTSQQPKTFISFEPEKNGSSYIMATLGLQNNTTSHISYQDYNVSAIYSYLKSIEQAIDQDPQDAYMKFSPVADSDSNPIVTDFNPGTNGQDLDIKNSIAAIEAALQSKAEQIQLSVNQTAPQNTLASTNSLGINRLVAQGDSDFSRSPANRIWNIKVGVQKETGTIIKPGQEFSFNKYLGQVDGEHGFKPELVITSNATVPEFGGGLCQVSTTMFRAAAHAGFPITARRNHSYAVEYYSPQGTDATIYPGAQDLKFINNTGADILIWSSFPGTNKLRFSIYGSSDGRQVAFQGPVVYDKKPDGSMKATWTRVVTAADGSKQTDIFKSNYLSPALFKKVMAFPSAVAPAAPTTSQSNTSTSNSAAPQTIVN